MKRTCLRSLSLLVLLPAAAGFAQIEKAPTVTTLTSSSPTLQLPGSLTITATVAPSPQFPIGMPSGSVVFLNNGNRPLGSAPLKTISATQKYAFPPIAENLGTDPYGIFTFSVGASKYSALGMIDQGPVQGDSGIAYPELNIYSGQGLQIFDKPHKYSLENSGINTFYPGVDAFGVGDFNHDGIIDVIVHGYNSTDSSNNGEEFYVLPGEAGVTFDITKGVISKDMSGITCDCSNPLEAITVDDFNGDGYADVAYASTTSGSNALVGVALNGGAGAPASFTNFVTAPTVPPTIVGETFQPAALATGHFTSSGYPDIAVAGTPSVGTNGYVALYLNKGPSGGTVSFSVPNVFTVGSQPNSIATSDFRANGMTDVVLATLVPSSQSGAVQVLFGDGKGHLTSSSTVPLAVELASVSVADVNNDGFPDIVVVGDDGSLDLLLNDGTGHFSAITKLKGASQYSYSTIGDFNGDGLVDLAELTSSPLNESTSLSAASVFLNSAASQATLVTAAQSLAPGTDAISAAFAGDSNFFGSASEAVPIEVTQTPSSLTWPEPAALEYGTPLSATQLDAQSSVPGAITYSLAPGVILKPGTTKVTATFVPADIFDYTRTTATQTITVTTPTLTGISPASGKLGDPSTTITVMGQGLVKGAVVLWNKTALSTTWVSLNELTAVVPESFFSNKITASITVIDPNKIAVSGVQPFTVVAPPATAMESVPTTVEAGQGGSVTLTVNPYPEPVTATLTLKFAPNSPNTIGDPSVLFPNNSTKETIQIPANSTAPIPAIDFSTGSTAGTITLTITLVASGVDVTPTSLGPKTITVPATAPVISSVTLDRSGKVLTVAISGISSTRDMANAEFTFTAASGSSLKTTSVPVELGTPFTNYYSTAQSDAFGTTFLYTQTFELSADAKTVGSVSVVLTNSVGASQPGTAQ